QGSFTQAGKVLQITQPSVSALIIDLQNELKVKLFEKLGIRPHLTEAGRRLLQLAEDTLAIIEKIPQEMDDVNGLRKGKLTVGGSGFAGATLLPTVVQGFKKAFPLIEIKVIIQPSLVLEEKLLNGELDIGLMGMAPKSRLIEAKPYREEKVVVIAPPHHPLAKKRSVPLKLLAQEPMVVDEKGTLSREMVEEVFKRNRLPFAPALEINVLSAGRDAIKSSVANGLGIGFIPEHCIPLEVKAGLLTVLNVADLKLKRAMYLAFHHKRRQNSLVRAFIEFAENYTKQ
ncbi:MAG TPA: LysR family transcriptional regulator, partial [Candidatus Binatia bacterium]